MSEEYDKTDKIYNDLQSVKENIKDLHHETQRASLLIGDPSLNESSKNILERLNQLFDHIDRLDRRIDDLRDEDTRIDEKLKSNYSDLTEGQRKLDTMIRDVRAEVSDFSTINDQLFLFLKGVFMGLGYESVGKTIQEIIDGIKETDQ